MVPLVISSEHVPPVGVVYLYHQLFVQLARLSLAVVALVFVCVRPTVEKFASVSSVVISFMHM